MTRGLPWATQPNRFRQVMPGAANRCAPVSHPSHRSLARQTLQVVLQSMALSPRPMRMRPVPWTSRG